MRANYPASIRGGVSQQAYEQQTLMQRNGVQRLLREACLVAGIFTDRVQTVVDPGCRAGDTTLGLALALPQADRIIGVEEYPDAVNLAGLKFEALNAVQAVRRDPAGIFAMLDDLPPGWVSSFQLAAELHAHRVSFACSPIEELPSAIGNPKADLVVGFQILHWLNDGGTGMPTPEVLRAIAQSMTPGAPFIAGTSTAFFSIDRDVRVEGKTYAEYAIDEHPFVKLLYRHLGSIVSSMTGRVPEPVTAQTRPSLQMLTPLLEAAGFTDVRVGGFLVGAGREALINEVVKIRPAHQGRLEGIPEDQRAAVVKTALDATHTACDLLASDGMTDPRKVETNLWDVVPFIVARRA